jgi:acetyl esterase/lipase
MSSFASDLAEPGSYVGYPRTFVSVGDAEAFQRECDQLVGLLQNDGVDVSYDVQQDAVHDFWGCSIAVPSNAARERLAKRIYAWIAGLVE